MSSISQSDAKAYLATAFGLTIDGTQATFEFWAQKLTTNKAIITALGKAKFGLLSVGFSFVLSEQETNSQKLAEGALKLLGTTALSFSAVFGFALLVIQNT